MPRRYYTYGPQLVTARKYGLSNFIGDVFLSFATGGLWIIWICIRELKN
jgi:hypothetical protein